MGEDCADYWMVANSLGVQSRESVYQDLQNRLLKTHLVAEVAIFDVPMSLKFLSFDNLIRCVDELCKHDSHVESVLRRIERQAVELAPNTDFEIFWQRNSMTRDQYVKRFSWDDAKYPRTRSLRENIDLILGSVSKLDDEIRAKTANWHDVKSQASVYTKKGNVSLIQKDLRDILTPEIARKEGFVETPHLTTAIVVIPRGAQKEWLQTYENLEKFVVPRSTRNYNVSDKEGNTLWSVVVFRSSLPSFKTAAKAKKFTVREFTYSEDEYYNVVENRTKLEAEKTRQENFLAKVCFAAYSDVFIGWVHLKAMRTFCESVLRFGVPPHFAAFWVKPVKEATKKKKARQELAHMFDKGFFPPQAAAASDPLLHEITGADNFYPYVSLTLSLSAQKLFNDKQ